MNFREILEIASELGTSLYLIATVIGTISPKSKFGQGCRKFAADLKQIMPAPIEEKTEGGK